MKNSKGKVIIIISLIMVCIVISGIVIFSKLKSNHLSLEEQMVLGEKYLVEENYEQAIILFKEIIQVDPYNINAYSGLADAYAGLGQMDNALKAMDEGMLKIKEYKELYGELPENSEDFILKAAVIYEQAGRSDRVKDILQQGYEWTESAVIKNKLESIEKSDSNEKRIETDNTVLKNDPEEKESAADTQHEESKTAAEEKVQETVAVTVPTVGSESLPELETASQETIPEMTGADESQPIPQPSHEDDNGKDDSEHSGSSGGGGHSGSDGGHSGETDSKTDYINILACKYDTDIVGEEAHFEIEVEYGLFNEEQGVIDLGFNTIEESKYQLLSDSKVYIDKGTGQATISGKINIVSWQDSLFKAHIIMSERNHGDNWKPLASDTQSIRVWHDYKFKAWAEEISTKIEVDHDEDPLLAIEDLLFSYSVYNREIRYTVNNSSGTIYDKNMFLLWDDIKAFSNLKTITLETEGYERLVDCDFDLLLRGLDGMQSLEALSIIGSELDTFSVFHNRSLPSLKTLSIQGGVFTSLEGLENLKNLEKFALYPRGAQSKIDDLTPLTKLENLNELYISDNLIKDITPLKDLKNLGILVLDNNQIEDITPLKNIKKFDNLDLSNNKISDISVLTGSDINTLNLRNNHVEILAADLAILDYAELSNNNIDDLSSLCDWDVNSLLLGNNNISDITPLKNLTGLTQLDLGKNNIEDISPLNTLVNLHHLNLSNNKISDIAPLETLINVWDLDLSYNKINTITTLNALTKLKKIILNNNNIQDITPLSSIKNFNTLNLDNNNIVDISALSGANIGTLNLNNNQIEILANEITLNGDAFFSNNNIRDLTPLYNWNVSFTRCIIMDGNNISDLTPLQNLKELNQLGLVGNNISDLTPLKGLVKLSNLGLNDNQISDLNPLSELINLRYLTLMNNSINDLSPLKQLKNLIYLNLCGNPDITDWTPVEHVRDLERDYVIATSTNATLKKIATEIATSSNTKLNKEAQGKNNYPLYEPDRIKNPGAALPERKEEDWIASSSNAG